MARPTLATHPKFFRLVELVGSRLVARGALELIWDAAYASGDPVVGDAGRVEAVASWQGSPGALASALADSGFLDLMQTDANGGHLHPVYAVHDLEDHAPDYVVKRWEREAARKKKGQSLRDVRREAARVRWAQSTLPVMQVSAAVPPPAPAPITDQREKYLAHARDPSAPAPAPAPVVPFTPPAARRELAMPRAPNRPYPPGAATLPFLEVFDRYPRKDKKLAAAAVWQELAEQHPQGETGLRDELLAWFDGGALTRHPYANANQFRPLFESVLTEQRWRDPPSAPDDQPAAPPARAGPATPSWDARRHAQQEAELREIARQHTEQEAARGRRR